jgi:hypothetical protein
MLDMKDEEPIGVGIDRSQIADTVQQDFVPRPLTWGKGGDGLPTPEIHSHLPLAPPLSPHTFVCLADESEFVLRARRWGEIVGRFVPALVKRAPDGTHFVHLDDAIYSGAPWLEIWRALDLRTRRVRVEPVRPMCSHYAEQMVDFGDDTDRQLLERLCTARRDDESFFVGLRDMQMHACHLRTPRDPVSDERLRIMNETKVALGIERMKQTGETFDVDKALRENQERADLGLTRTNIFAQEGDD